MTKPESDFSQIKIPPHRSEAVILEELERLCASPGYIHALSFLCFRENFAHYSDEFKTEDLAHAKSLTRLIRTEISLLIGLMVKSTINLNLQPDSIIEKQINKSEELLEELHHSMNAKLLENLKSSDRTSSSFMSGLAIREPIFYAGEYAYIFQYRDFAVERYENDKTWIQNNKGFTPENVNVVIKSIANIQIKKFEIIYKKISEEKVFPSTLLSAFSFTKEELAYETGYAPDIVYKVLKAFSLKEIPCNQKFCEIGSFNQIIAYPIIPSDNETFILFQNYNLAESSYDSPTFWMSEDKSYIEQAKKNRGQFSESFSAKRLGNAIGKNHIHKNVCVIKGKNRIGEIDVLVIYGDRALIVQAKSKKLTEEARKGYDKAIQSDFQKAVQDSYDQAYRCAEALGDENCYLIDEWGNPLNIRQNYSEIFLFCVISEYYPSLARQAEHFLKKHEHPIISYPYVMDIFFLDVLCEFLNKPLRFFNFLHQRLKYYTNLTSENELPILAYHLTHNLFFNSDFTHITLSDDLSLPIDIAMAVRREGMPGEETPKGILTKYKNSFFEDLIEQISSNENDNLFDIGYFLLEIGENSVRDFSKNCLSMIINAQKDRSAHDFSLVFDKKGITVNTNFEDIVDARKKLRLHCEAKKYQQKAHQWFGLLLSPQDGALKYAVGLNFPWEESEIKENLVKIFLRKTPKISRTNLAKNSTRNNKIGRNKSCPCGSGKKYKKCCLDLKGV